jgi:hypothetical protein
MVKKKQSLQGLEEHFAMPHKVKPAPFNPDYNPGYAKRCEELEMELREFRDQAPEPSRAEKIRRQAELYSEIYGADYPAKMAQRYPECFPELQQERDATGDKTLSKPKEESKKCVF